MSVSPSAHPADPPPPDAARTWRVGTLVYTSGGLILVFCWLLGGDFAWSMRDRAAPPIMQLLFGKFSSSDTLTGFLFTSLPAALTLVIAPVVGYQSDRLRSRWGRRIPFLLATTPFIVCSMVGLAFSVHLGASLDYILGLRSPGAATTTLMVMGLFWTCFEISCVTANAVFGGLVNDVVPAAIIGRFYGFFRAFSLAAGMVFYFWLMKKAETYYVEIFLGIALLYGVGFTLMCLKVKEGQYPPPPAPPVREHGFLAGIMAYLHDSFSHSYYLLYFAAIVLAGLSALPFNLYALFYAKSLGVTNATYGNCITLTYGISLLLAYPLGALADRFHPLRMTIVALALYAFAMAWGGLFVSNAPTFAFALVAHGVLSGVFFTASASLGQRLLPRNKFTELASAGGVLASLSSMTIAPVLGQFLDHAHHAYRHTFHAGLFFTCLALLASLFLHRRFMALGGPGNYLAPPCN